MANHCITCYKGLGIPNPTEQERNEKDISSKSREKCEMFFKLLERYLNEPGDKCFQPFPVWENIFDAGIPISCGACQELMESFSELFHQMKSIELLINWKLWTLKNIMHSAERVPSRLNEFKEAFMQMKFGYRSGVEQLILVLNFKSDLIKNCRRKLLTTSPRLKLVKFSVKQDEPVRVPVAVEECTDDTDIGFTNCYIKSINIKRVLSYCIICYKGFGIPVPTKQVENDISSKSREKCELFFKLLERYLKEPEDKFVQPFPVLENIFDAGTPISCGVCQKVMECFCELFHEMKSIQLVINWKLWTLKNIMYSAERVPSRLNDFKNAILQMTVANGSNVEQLNLILKFKRDLIKNCRRKLLATFPRLELVKSQEKKDESVQALKSKISEGSSRKKEKTETASYRVSKLRKTIIIRDETESPLGSPNIGDNRLNFGDCIAESLERCARADQNVGSETIDDVATENTTLVAVAATTEPGSELEESTLASLTELEETEESSTNRFRDLHRCVKCTKTFSTVDRLFEHQQTHKTGNYSHSKSDENSSLETENSEPDFSCSDDEENDSESDDSEPEYFSDDDINAKEGFNEEERGKDLQLLTGSDGKKCVQRGCEAHFPNYLQLRKHERNIHGIDKRNTCADCNMTFGCGRDLRNHDRKMHKNKLKFVCPFENCGNRFKTDELLEGHVQLTHKRLQLMKCPKCEKQCWGKHNLNQHMNSHSSVPVRRTRNSKRGRRQVTETGTELEELPTVIEVEETEESSTSKLRTVHRCVKCTKTFSTFDRLSDHQQTHKKENYSHSKSDEDSSLETENSESDFSCSDDEENDSDSEDEDSEPEYFSDNQINVEEDFNEEERGKDPELKSPQSTSTLRPKLETTIADQHGQFAVKPECSSHDEGSEHVLLNPVTKDGRACKICKWAFNDRKNMKRHYNTFHNPKNLIGSHVKKCRQTGCPAYFLTTMQLQKHEKQVHAIKKRHAYTCDDCNMTFNNRSSLRGHHLQKHKHKLNHVCTLKNCGKRFKTSKLLERHVKAIHEQNLQVFQCPKCEKKCLGRAYLQKHMELHSSATRKARISISNRGRRRQKVAKIGSSSDETDDNGSNFMELDGLTCAICKLTLCSRTGMKQHYNIQHNLEKSTGSDVKKCVETGCGAYFLTSMQLRAHEKSMHAICKRKEYKCVDCNIIYSSAPGLRMHHLVKHAHELNFVCTVENCGSRFKTNELLQRHTKRIHEQQVQLIKCPTCEKPFWGEGSLKNHLKSHSSAPEAGSSEPGQQQLFHCNVTNCATKLTNEEDFENHKQLHGKFTCFFCDDTKDHALELAKHEIKEHSAVGGRARCSNRKRFKSRPTIFTCPRPNCSLRCNREETYIGHFVSEHIGLTALANKICTICNLTLSHSTRLKDHYHTHHNLKNSTGSDAKKCEQTGCPAYFLTYLQLRAHERKSHGIDKRLTCADCNITFKDSWRLYDHDRRKHSDELNYVCSFENCDKRYKTNELLEGHFKRVHEQKRQLMKCPKCDKSLWGEFSFQTHLKSHSQVRKVARNFICKQCNKAFNSKDKLEIHYLSHSGPSSWKFECSICSRKCLTHQKLDEHMRTHTKEKPFICKICKKEYGHRHNLRIHVNGKHGKVTQDKPRKFNKVNLTSRKGIKRKKKKKVEEDTFSESSCDTWEQSSSEA